MYVTELNHDQLIELKNNYLCQLDDEGTLLEVAGIEKLDYGTFANADEIVSDDFIIDYYWDICFVEDDFFCSCC